MTKSKRDAMFSKYHYLVIGIVRKMKCAIHFRGEEDDLCADGSIGLLDAINKFDPSRNIRFASYAAWRIKGAVIDGLRKRNWVSRTVQKNITRMERTTQELAHELNRPPHQEETARRMKISMVKLKEIEEKAVAQSSPELQGLSSDVMLANAPSNSPAPEDATQFRDLVEECVTLLTEREEFIWRMYYVNHLTMREIGGMCGISESRTCQIIKHLKERVRLPA